MTPKTRVIVAVAHDNARVGVARLISSARDVHLVGEASCTQALSALLDAHACEVVVTDIAMPGLDGAGNAVPFLRRLLRRQPHPQVIALVTAAHGHQVVGLRQIGVTGIVDKRDAAESLLDAIAAVCAGGLHLSPRVRDVLNDQQHTPVAAGPLSAREWEVFQLHAQGLAIHAIARRLKRSGKTISTQKRSAMLKLGLKTKADLVDYAREIGLL